MLRAATRRICERIRELRESANVNTPLHRVQARRHDHKNDREARNANSFCSPVTPLFLPSGPHSILTGPNSILGRDTHAFVFPRVGSLPQQIFRGRSKALSAHFEPGLALHQQSLVLGVFHVKTMSRVRISPLLRLQLMPSICILYRCFFTKTVRDSVLSRVMLRSQQPKDHERWPRRRYI